MAVPAYDGASAAASVVMSAEIRSKPILFVEGVCEVRLLGHHYPEHESGIVPCGGHAGVREALNTIESWENKNQEELKVLGLLDRDYGSKSNCRRTTSSNNRDVEIDMYLSLAGERLLREKASRKKCPNPREVLSQAMDELRIVGLVRKFNSDNHCSWNINSIDLERYVNSDGEFKSDQFLARLRQLNSIDDASMDTLLKYFGHTASARVAAVLRGHDVSILLGKWLRRRIGNRKKADTVWNVLEENLRLSTCISELLKYHWVRRVRSHLMN